MLRLRRRILSAGHRFPRRIRPALGDIARRIGVLDRFQNFTRGIVSLRDLIYFASFIFFFLFLNTVILEQRRAD